MKVVLLVLSLLLFPSLVLAFDGPNLESPPNDSTISSSKLTWQTPNFTLASSKPYRVQIDNSSDFADPEKDYTTDNLNYSPRLDEGTYFWRVKAKNNSDVWSNWSTVWQFTLSKTQTSQTAPNTPNSENPTKEKPSSSFSISDIPKFQDINTPFSIKTSLTLPNNPNSKFYLKAAFQKDGSTNYFGYTKVSDSWIKNSSSYTNQLEIQTDSAGIWSGTLEIKVDPEDSGYKDNGDYQLKVARYTQTGSGPTWSNSEIINLTGAIQNNSEETESIEYSNEESEVNTDPDLSDSIIKNDYQIASVAGQSIHSDNIAPDFPEVKSEKTINWFLISLSLFTLLTGSSVFVYLKKRGYNIKL